jgi:hypothetical protein
VLPPCYHKLTKREGITPSASNTTAIRIDDKLNFFIAHSVLDVIYHADGNKEKVICGERRQVLVEWEGLNQPEIELNDDASATSPPSGQELEPSEVHPDIIL